MKLGGTIYRVKSSFEGSFGPQKQQIHASTRANPSVGFLLLFCQIIEGLINSLSTHYLPRWGQHYMAVDLRAWTKRSKHDNSLFNGLLVWDGSLRSRVLASIINPSRVHSKFSYYMGIIDGSRHPFTPCRLNHVCIPCLIRIPNTHHQVLSGPGS